ncbi:MAG: site-specific DNA-methyltransferase [Bacteroidaceae bacterium]|nr:site-specific DNA-methyltransferase [Bacteroidaceae bacterium]
MKYQVTITETLSRKISIEAPTAEIAEEQVRGLYRDEEIVLGNSDFCYFNVDVCGEEAEPFYLSTEGDFSLYFGDCMELLLLLGDKVDMVFADPPYFLSNGGISVQSGKIVSVNKGEWDKGIPVEEIHAFNMKWIGMCRDVLTDNGTIWISGTYHNIFSVANALASLGFKILNVITWVKTNPPPNISCRYFTYSTEFIIWARKMAKVPHYYNYELMKAINGDKQMTDVWRLPAIAPWEKTCGKHPTQKPLSLMSRIILASTKKGDKILDPFCGSGTTGIAANLLERKFVGIEREREYVEMSKRRRQEIENPITAESYRTRIKDIDFVEHYEYML